MTGSLMPAYKPFLIQASRWLSAAARSADDGFAGARLRIADLAHDQPLGPAEFAENDGFHDG